MINALQDEITLTTSLPEFSAQPVLGNETVRYVYELGELEAGNKERD